jgi:FkbM family methyltransferase
MAVLFKRALRPGICVLDIGANIGYYTLLAAKAGAKIQAFEPDATNLHYLLRNLQCNQLGHRVTVVQKVIADRVGVASFYPHQNLLESSLFSELAPGEPTAVECTTVDASFDEHQVLNLVKVDIEGAELKALRGMDKTIARSSKNLKMFIECYPVGLQAAEASPAMLLDWLASRGFETMAIDEKNQCLRSVDSIDLQRPQFQDEPVRAFNLYCVRKGQAF